MSDIGDWYRRLPQFTRYWLTATVGISLLARFSILPAHLLPLIPKYIWDNWQVRRIAGSDRSQPLRR